MKQPTITQRMKAYAETSLFSETGLSQMLGMGQSVFNRLIKDEYRFGSVKHEHTMQVFLDETAVELDRITNELKGITSDKFVSDVPDSVLFKRMQLHSQRCKLLNKETRMRQSSTSGASFQSV